MDRQQREFTEHKLLLLYILEKLAFPLSNLQLSRIVWEFDLMNYFDMQQCLSELVEAGLVDCMQKPQGQCYDINVQGKNTLEQFQNRLRLSHRTKLDAYAEANREALLLETQFFSEIKQDKPGHFLVRCQVVEWDRPIFGVEFDVPTQQQAQSISKRWQSQAAEIYQYALEKLCRE